MKSADTVTATELLARLAEGNGTLHVRDPEAAIRAAYRRAIHRVLTEHLVPAGQALRHSGRDRGDLTIRLVPLGPEEKPVNAPRVAIPTSLDGAPADIAALASGVAPATFSTAGWGRALLILDALADAATLRGYGFAVRRDVDVIIEITIGEDTQDFLLAEELERRNVPDEAVAGTIKYDWQRVPTRPTLVPTGRLFIRTTEHYGAKTWADRRRWQLDDKLGEVLALAEQRCQHAALERRRAQDKAREQRRIWDEAVPQAHALYAEAINRERLDAQVAAWRRAQGYRDYAAALTALAGDPGLDDQARVAVTDWIGFIQEQILRVDPEQKLEDLRRVVPEMPPATDLDRFMPRGMTVLRPPAS